MPPRQKQGFNDRRKDAVKAEMGFVYISEPTRDYPILKCCRASKMASKKKGWVSFF